MKRLILCPALFAAASFSGLSQVDNLPDLQSHTIVAITENAYTPLNFIESSTGEGIGWKYDAMHEIAKPLNVKVDWQLSNADTMIQSVTW